MKEVDCVSESLDTRTDRDGLGRNSVTRVWDGDGVLRGRLDEEEYEASGERFEGVEGPLYGFFSISSCTAW